MRSRWTPRRLGKLDAQCALLDRVVKVLDTKVKERRAEEAKRDPVLDRVRALIEEEDHVNTNPSTFFWKDGFEKHATQIKNQIISKGFCTRAQLEFLMLYNEKCDFEERLLVDKETLADTKIFGDKQDGHF